GLQSAEPELPALIIEGADQTGPLPVGIVGDGVLPVPGRQQLTRVALAQVLLVRRRAVAAGVGQPYAEEEFPARGEQGVEIADQAEHPAAQLAYRGGVLARIRLDGRPVVAP